MLQIILFVWQGNSHSLDTDCSTLNVEYITLLLICTYLCMLYARGVMWHSGRTETVIAYYRIKSTENLSNDKHVVLYLL